MHDEREIVNRDDRWDADPQRCRVARGEEYIEVIGFGDEEGVRFGTTMLGSRAIAGALDLSVLDTRDAAGVTVRDALREFGLDPAGVPKVARKKGDVAAYAELHIEQGPVLEAEGLPVGVVTALIGGPFFLWLLVKRS